MAPGQSWRPLSGPPLSSTSFISPSLKAFFVHSSSGLQYDATTSCSNRILYIILSSGSFTTTHPRPWAHPQDGWSLIKPQATSGLNIGDREQSGTLSAFRPIPKTVLENRSY